MKKALNNLRMLGIDMINQAQSGHPGIVLGAAPMMFTLWTKFINVHPERPAWFNRDRFVLSAGHGSALLYSMLYFAGFDYHLDDLKNFRQIGSITPGHPEYDLKRGVEMTSGPLGQGLATSVGMALAEKMLASNFNKPNLPLIDHYTYVLCSDGDVQEGVSYETMSLAGQWKLNKLIVLYDSNDIQLDSHVRASFTEDMKQRCWALNWEYYLVNNGEDIEQIAEMIDRARRSKIQKPHLIEIKTKIGFGSPKVNTVAVHGAPLNQDDLVATRKFFNWKNQSFIIEPNILQYYHDHIAQRGSQSYQAWLKVKEIYQVKYPSAYKTLFEEGIKNNLTLTTTELNLPQVTGEQPTRVSSGIILQALSQRFLFLVGGSADLSRSTHAIGGAGQFSAQHRTGRNIMFGVREFGMATINNGLTLHHGLRSFASTFFCFLDYLKPALRLSALMGLTNFFVMTHDSYLLGEDGPTHEPVEQLAICRAQPNTLTFRPADFRETLGVYLYHINQNHSFPSVIILSRQKTKQLQGSIVSAVAKGAYVVYGSDKANIIITSTGTDVNLSLQVATILEQDHQLKLKVVSMPCRELFEKQSTEYQRSIYCGDEQALLKVTYENASTLGWNKYGSLNIGINHFGASGKANDILKRFKLDPPSVANKINNHFMKLFKK